MPCGSCPSICRSTRSTLSLLSSRTGHSWFPIQFQATLLFAIISVLSTLLPPLNTLYRFTTWNESFLTPPSATENHILLCGGSGRAPRYCWGMLIPHIYFHFLSPPSSLMQRICIKHLLHVKESPHGPPILVGGSARKGTVESAFRATGVACQAVNHLTSEVRCYFCIPVVLTLVSSVQELNHIQLFVTSWTAAHEASLSITNSQSLLKLMSIKWVQMFELINK